MNTKIHKTTVSVIALAMLFFTLAGCKSKGYDDLNVLYTDFVSCFKTGGDDLKAFCRKISPNENTAKYMKKNGFSYRGFPEKFEALKLGYDTIAMNYYNQLNTYRNHFADQLNDLEYIGMADREPELFDKELGIYATESYIYMKSGNDTLSLGLGELFKINGEWKVFTAPQL